MRRAQIALVLTVVAFGAHANAENDASFESFKKLFNRVYATKEEEATRRAYFLQNMQRAAELKKRNPEAEFGMNVYSDLSANEFKRRHNAEAFYRRAASKPRSVKSAAEVKGDGADKSDWRKKGAVTAVKNQGDCGSCWSFSTTGNIEGQWQIAGNTLVSLSEQELVSCDTTCDGCNGGLMDDAFEWIVNSQGGGITSESSYPYVSGTGVVPACDMSGLTSYAYISGHQDVAHSESAMASWVSANGPLSVGVDASSWQTYQNGILSDCTSNQVDHGVLIVGFDLSAATPYWIIKNSWGPTWGEEGYIRVAYGSNQCLITTAPSSSIVSTGPQPPAPNPNPPSPDSGSGTFTQYTCSSLFCLSGCSSSTFSTGQCLSMSGGGSAIATCGASNLYLAVYTSSDCSGTSTTSEIPLDQCSQDTSGSYIYDTCSSGSALNSASSLGAEAQPSFVRLPLKKK